jgi:hypothetical protein
MVVIWLAAVVDQPPRASSLQQSAGACLTTTGTPCRLPFLYEGRQRWACITDHDPEGLFWCSTAVDAAGAHVQGSWGHCQPDCPQSGRTPTSCTSARGEAGQCMAATACIGVDLSQLEAAVSSDCPSPTNGDLLPTVCCPTVTSKVVELPAADVLPAAENLSEAEENSLAKLFEAASQETAQEEAEANQLDVGFRAGNFPGLQAFRQYLRRWLQLIVGKRKKIVCLMSFLQEDQ